MSSYRVEYGVELTWPDGSKVDVMRGTKERAEEMVAWHEKSDCTVRIISRLITTGPWQYGRIVQ